MSVKLRESDPLAMILGVVIIDALVLITIVATIVYCNWERWMR